MEEMEDIHLELFIGKKEKKYTYMLEDMELLAKGLKLLQMEIQRFHPRGTVPDTPLWHRFSPVIVTIPTVSLACPPRSSACLK